MNGQKKSMATPDKPQLMAWQPVADALLPKRTRALLEAIVRAAGVQDVRILERLLPPIDIYHDILEDAWETISGDDSATQRFTERLRILQQAICCESPDAAFADPAEDAIQNLHDQLIERCKLAPAEIPVIPADAAGLLIMAAVHAGQGDAIAEHRNLATVLAQLRGYDRVRAVLVEVNTALGGNETSGCVVRKLIDRLSKEADRDPSWRRVTPWPRDYATKHLPADHTEIDHWIMATESLLAWNKIWIHPVHKNPGLYWAVTVSPNTACAGDQITITGKGFGSTKGKVRFHTPPGKGQGDILAVGTTSYWDVTPQSWSDTQIVVTVPLTASCGKFVVRIPTGTATVSGKTVQTYKDIGPLKISGTLPEIIDFRANGTIGGVTAKPGDMVDITWYTCPDDADVTLEVKVDGSPLWTKSGLASYGSETLPVGGVKTTTYTATLTAKTVCGTASKTLNIVVHKSAQVYMEMLETTQVTQFFMGGTTLPKTANSVPLIAGKATLVRAYLSTTQDPSFNNGEIANAQVELRGWFQGGGELPGSPLSPINTGTITAGNQGTYSSRKDLNATANFLIPSSWMVVGPTLKLEARVWLPAGSLDAVDTKNETATLTGVRFHNSKPLDVVIVLVNHTGPCDATSPTCNGTPTMTDAVKTLHMVRRIYPTDKLRVFLPEAGDQIVNFARDKGCGVCGSIGCIIDDLGDISKGYDNDDDMVWWAAIKVGVGGQSGCGGTGSGCIGYATSRVTDPSAAWHEIGHAYGRDHTFEDSSYPKYGFTGAQSIGEFGVDVEKLNPYPATNVNQHVYDPYLRSDFMSYESDPVWVSPYTYMGLMTSYFAPSASGGSVVTSVPGAKPRRDREERLVVCGKLWTETGEVELNPLYHLPMYPKDYRKPSTRYALALVDAKGRTLVQEALRLRLDGAESCNACASAAKLRISQTIAFDQEAAAFEVREEGKVLLRVERPAIKPALEDVTLERGGKHWVLRWRASHPDGIKLHQTVVVTYDDGMKWQRLRVGFKGAAFRFDPATLAGGERCRLRVIVSDGFNTVLADSETFALPVKPPQILLLDPQEDATVVAGTVMYLQVEAISPRFGSLEGEAIRWESDRQGLLGTGRELWVELTPGQHRITVTAASGPESVSTKTFVIRIREEI